MRWREPRHQLARCAGIEQVTLVKRDVRRKIGGRLERPATCTSKPRATSSGSVWRPMKPAAGDQDALHGRSRDTWRRARTRRRRRRPLDTERRVVPAHAARRLGHVVRSSGRGPRSRRRASGSRARNPAGMKYERHAGSPPRSSTPNQRQKVADDGPQVDGDVVDGAARAAHQLALAVRRGLVVQAAQRPRRALNDDVALRRTARQARRAANSSASKVRAKNPRSSRSGSSSTTNAPGQRGRGRASRTAA